MYMRVYNMPSEAMYVIHHIVQVTRYMYRYAYVFMHLAYSTINIT